MATNKNSLYVQSLVSFLNDTKPYHSKITEVVEEYRFFDDMIVNMQERFFNNVTLKSSWPYNFFSAGPGGNFSFPLHQVLNTNTRPGKFSLAQANQDLPGVPLAFDPKSMSGPGMKDTYVRRGGSSLNAQPLLEGHDIYQSHGAFVFSIRQTKGSNQSGTFIKEYTVSDGPFPLLVNLSFSAESLFITGPAVQVTPTSIEVTGAGTVRVFGVNEGPMYDTQYKELKNQALFAHITNATQQLALDVTNPRSAISQLMVLMEKINLQITLVPSATASRTAFDEVTASIPRRASLDSNTNRVLETHHSRVDGDTLKFTVLPAGSGLVTGTSYFVLNATTSGYQLSLTAGGPAISVPVFGDAVVASMAPIDLPRSYEALLTALELEGVDYQPLGGLEGFSGSGYSGWAWGNKKVSFSEAFDEVQQPDHAFADGNEVRFYELSGDTNLTEGTPYYVLNRTSSTYQLALTVGGPAIEITGSGSAYVAPRNGETYVDLDLASLSPGLYFNQYTDVGQRETGNLRYSDVVTDKLVVTNIVGDVNALNYEEWSLSANSSSTLIVIGTSSGAVGVIEPTPAGVTFVSPQISFTATSSGVIFADGDDYLLTPEGEVTIHKDAPLETWSVIKANPRTYSRPSLQSLRFGFLQDQAGLRDFITVLDPGFPTSTVVIRALSATQFQITNTVEPGYLSTAAVGAPFSDGRLAFTIVAGNGYQFRIGDTFFVQIQNDASTAEDLDLYYGYDSGPYDSSNPVYNVVSSLLDDYLKTIDFNYDSRFLNYNLAAFNLQLSPSTPEGEWRLRAEADATRPLQMPLNSTSLLDTLMVKVASTANVLTNGAQIIDDTTVLEGDLVLLKDQTDASMNGVYRVSNGGAWTRVDGYPVTGSGTPEERLDLNVIRVTQGTANSGTYWKRATPQVDFTYEQTSDLFDMPNDVSYEGPQSATDLDLSPDILLWYANTFALERFDIGTGAWVTVTSGIAVNAPHFDATNGLSFTIVPAAKPFIAAQITSTTYTDTAGTQSTSVVDSGDTIYFKVTNNPPQQTEPAGLTSLNVPRLVMHGDSYYSTVPAVWTLIWNSATTYSLQGVYTLESPLAGQQVFAVPQILSTINSASYLNKQFGVHWTVVQGIAGLAAGDRFTFETYRVKPSYLVYGSVSGWQPDAEIGKWYWNGKIGFLIRRPRLHLFVDGVEEQIGDLSAESDVPSGGAVSVLYARPDLRSCVYRAFAPADGRWLLYRDGELVAFGEVNLDDGFIRLEMPPAIVGTEFFIRVDGDTHDLAVGADLAIVRTDSGRAPAGDDILVVEKTETDFLNVSVQPINPAASTALAPLFRVNVNPLFVDHNAQSGVPLSVTSPEILLTTGFIPALPVFSNADGPTAFSDEATSVTLIAAATGETIGTAQSLTSNPKEPVLFTWDASFAAKYLPLNTDASIVTYGTGTDERMVVNMYEGIHFLLSGGGLDSGSLFSEIIQVRLTDDHFMGLRTSYNNDMGVLIEDGPFGGFLPGYDNMPYDLEQHPDLQQYLADAAAARVTVLADIQVLLDALRVNIDAILTDMVAATDFAGVTTPDTPSEAEAKRVIEAPFYALIDAAAAQTSLDLDALDVLGGGFGYYDVGHPFVGFFERAKGLAALNVPTAAEETELSLLLQRVNPYISSGDILSTTLEQFQAALNADTLINTAVVPNFGIPSRGLGISINEKPQGQAETKLLESVVINITDFGRPYDAYGYDLGELDAAPDLLVQIYSQTPPPLPPTGLPPVGTFYENFESPVLVLLPARTIEIGFSNPPGAVSFYVWTPTDVAPRQIEIVEEVSDRRFRMSIHAASEFKLIIV